MLRKMESSYTKPILFRLVISNNSIRRKYISNNIREYTYNKI